LEQGTSTQRFFSNRLFPTRKGKIMKAILSALAVVMLLGAATTAPANADWGWHHRWHPWHHDWGWHHGWHHGW
jgi:Spy/CpxP family protein refolding chaperone